MLLAKLLGCYGRKQRHVVKNGAVVDTECEFQEVVHVWRDANGRVVSSSFIFKCSLA